MQKSKILNIVAKGKNNNFTNNFNVFEVKITNYNIPLKLEQIEKIINDLENDKSKIDEKIIDLEIDDKKEQYQKDYKKIKTIIDVEQTKITRGCCQII